MKAVLAAMAGFVLTLGVFAGGVAVAMATFKASPVDVPDVAQDVTDVWTSEPVSVQRGARGLERVAAATPAAVPAAETSPAGLDETTTAALPADNEPAPARDDLGDELLVAHVDWCYARYRSYSAEDNSYRPYDGGRRACVSPYLEELEAMLGGGDAAEPEYAYADESSSSALLASVDDAGGFGDGSIDGVMMPDPAHVRDCFSRYRSYRPDDNTYQPYGGGPRRQCE